jgi:protein-tyrosine phosphatase
MRPELWWIDGPWHGRLAIVSRPRGGDWLDDEVRSWRSAGLDVVVSLLTSDEIDDLDLAQEARLCRANGIELLSFPIVDRSVPASQKATLDFVRKLERLLAGGRSVAIHCRQGIGRSALIAACLFVFGGNHPELALRAISAARGCSVPETPDQRQWVIEFARMLTPVAAKG